LKNSFFIMAEGKMIFFKAAIPVCLALATMLLPLNAVAASNEFVLYGKGLKHLESNRLEAAITAFSRVLSLSPDNAGAYRNRGKAYIKNEQYDLAIRDLEMAEQLQGSSKELYINLGVAWHQKGNYLKAVDHYNRAIEQFPDDHSDNHIVFFNRGLSHMKQEAYGSAREDMEKALALKPDLYWAICYKGDMLAKTRDTQEARKTYEAALALKPDNPYAEKQLSALREKVSEDTFHIQTGAFRNPENAERQRRALIERHLDATVVSKEIRGETYHIVQVGRFKTEADARPTLEALKDESGINAFIQKTPQ